MDFKEWFMSEKRLSELTRDKPSSLMRTFLDIFDPFWFTDIDNPDARKSETEARSEFQASYCTVLQIVTSVDNNPRQLFIT
jgi:hypothetical protein